jgi:hypothetical protein
LGIGCRIQKPFSTQFVHELKAFTISVLVIDGFKFAVMQIIRSVSA